MTVWSGFLPNLVGDSTIENSEVQTEYLDYFTGNIQSFGSILICVVCDIDETPPFGDSISLHCGVFHIFWLVPDQLF